jgi:hypothetical protein
LKEFAAELGIHLNALTRRHSPKGKIFVPQPTALARRAILLLALQVAPRCQKLVPQHLGLRNGCELGNLRIDLETLRLSHFEHSVYTAARQVRLLTRIMIGKSSGRYGRKSESKASSAVSIGGPGR